VIENISKQLKEYVNKLKKFQRINLGTNPNWGFEIDQL